MIAIQGYYDGTAIVPLEVVNAKQNQKVIITIMDEFIEPETNAKKKSMRGILAKYADKNLREKEKGAYERAMVEKYGDV